MSIEPKLRLPAEWEPHRATWLAWPKALGTWSQDILEDVQQRYIEFMLAIAQHEHVELLVDDEETKEQVLFLLQRNRSGNRNIHFHLIPTNDAWMRDFGPDWVFLEGKKLAVKWQFNSWGGKYPFDLDQQAGEYVAGKSDSFHTRAEILEGGSFETDGQGTFMLTKECLLHPNRNHEEVSEVEQLFRESFGATGFIWLNKGIVGDDTDGHIDDIARFAPNRTILIAEEQNEDDANYGILMENQTLLENYNASSEDPFTIVKLPMPQPVFHQNERLPASYLNFYVANGIVIVPTFSQSTDSVALTGIARAFPDRKVIGLEAGKVVAGLGAWHCLSKHEPEVVDNL